jgi:hypothetical protein
MSVFEQSTLIFSSGRSEIFVDQKLSPWERHIPSDLKADVASTRLCSSEVPLNYKEVAPTALPKTDLRPLDCNQRA